jgi:large subunit ribosomal protein L13
MNLNQTTTIPSGKDIQRKWFVLDARPDPRPPRLARRQRPRRQAQPALHPLHRYGRSRHRHQRREDPGHRHEGRPEALSPLHRLPRRSARREYSKLLVRRPEKILEEAIKGMLPKSKLGRQMATKLKVYKGSEHPHHAQQPIACRCTAPARRWLHQKQEA